jgi:hypothetical protein
VSAAEDLADFLHDLAVVTRRKLDVGSTYEREMQSLKREFEFLKVRAESLQGKKRLRALQLLQELSSLLGFKEA